MRGLVILVCIVLLSSSNLSTNEVPPFIFPKLDQALIQVWLSANAQDAQTLSLHYETLLQQWQTSRTEIGDFPLQAYNPYLFIGTVDALVGHLDQAQNQSDFLEIQDIINAIQREFQIARQFHRQDYYPLDLWWDVQSIFTEIHSATNDPKLGLLEWQELECLFDEMVCVLHDYEQRAEAHMTIYAPQVDEDKHKAAMNEIYECIASYQKALMDGYQENLVWPCDQIKVALTDILRCYLMPAAEAATVQ
ncbi:MAG: hypothetical protein AAFP77_07570 [Bacteroidota bacterium]